MPASISAPDMMPPHRALDDVTAPRLAALASQVIEDSRAVVSAEVALAKVKVGERIGAYRSAIVFFVVAAVLALAALVALLVGLILSLATLIGPVGATAAVVGAVLLIALVLALVGKGRLAPPDLEKGK